MTRGSRNLAQIVSHVILQMYETAAKPLQRRSPGWCWLPTPDGISNAKNHPDEVCRGRELRIR
jgi:hypothetical protein